jgi:hypothetical protein
MNPLSELVAELLVVASAAVPGAGDVAPPTIRTLEPNVLQQKACGRPCKVLAWFGPDGVIYLDERIDPQRNAVGRSILLHELVHHVQCVATGHSASSCRDWLAREQQAYGVQAEWLFKNRVDATAVVWQARLMRCNPAAMQQHGQAHKK